MRTTVQHTRGDVGVLQVVDVATPTPGDGEVLVRLGAAGINPIDVVVRSGIYRARDRVADPVTIPVEWHEPPFTLGWDIAGTVDAVGAGASPFQPGDEVFGLVGFPALAGTHADAVVASADELVRRPASLDVESAGALPLVGLTAWQALAGIADLRPGQRVLIHAAAGGVGHVAVQVAKALGAFVIGTASAAKHDFVRGLGADEVIDYRTTDFTTAVAPVDVVFDLVGGDYAERSATVLAPGGLLIGSVGGHLGITPERAAELGIRVEVVSVRPSAADLGALVRLVDEGRLRVHVEHAVPLADIAKAHELLDDGHVAGKVVIVP